MGRREYGLDNDTVRAIAADIGDVVGHGRAGLHRDRRRQHLPRRLRRRRRHGARPGRLHGHAGDGDERARHAVARWRSAASPPGCSPPSRCPSVCEPYIRRRAERHMEKGRVVDLRRRHRQPVLHHRYRRRAARRRNAVRRPAQGHPGGRRLFRRSAQGRRCRALRAAHLSRGAGERPRRDGCRRHQPGARERLPIVVFNIHAPGAFAAVVRGEGRFTRIIEQQ